MEVRHAVALALMGWFLMVPPITRVWPPVFDLDAPVARWTISGTFDSASECDKARKAMIEKAGEGDLQVLIPEDATDTQKREAVRAWGVARASSECVASDDQRLKQQPSK